MHYLQNIGSVCLDRARREAVKNGPMSNYYAVLYYYFCTYSLILQD